MSLREGCGAQDSQAKGVPFANEQAVELIGRALNTRQDRHRRFRHGFRTLRKFFFAGTRDTVT